MSHIDTPEAPPPKVRMDGPLVGILQHGAGVALVLAAWVWVFTEHSRAATAALLPALLIVTSYGANRIRFSAVLERAVLLVGICTIAAPWLPGFTAAERAIWTPLVLGGVAIASAATWLKVARQP